MVALVWRNGDGQKTVSHRGLFDQPNVTRAGVPVVYATTARYLRYCVHNDVYNKIHNILLYQPHIINRKEIIENLRVLRYFIYVNNLYIVENVSRMELGFVVVWLLN